jgi:hypothetical protein
MRFTLSTFYLKYKKQLMLGGALLAVACLIGVSIFVIVTFPGQEKEPEEESIQKVTLDDRISPYSNQALILEILRIRHRGILDELMTVGQGWKNPPQFYFVVDMDGQEYASNEVSGGVASGGSSENLFKTWDTILRENKVQIDVEEEQETSDVTLSIVERITSGILLKRHTDIEQETIQLVYDYRTGRWTGDDFFMDDDGYGHYVGETFEVWFNLYQTGEDWDTIPYWMEVNVLGTDPSVDDTHKDPDHDGIPTVWEWRWGYDPNVWDDHENLDPDIDGIENIEEYQMEKYFADPYQRDIYIETDGMEGGGLFDPAHVFHTEAQQALIERFTEHGINMYIDDGWPDGPINGGGEMLPHDYEKISQESGMMLQYYMHHFADERKGIFRYVLMAHQAGFNHPSVSNRYDTIAVGTNLKTAFTVKQAFTERTRMLMEAAYVMHELGHSLGIEPWTHEGCDNFSFSGSLKNRQSYDEVWGNYYSVMNYYHITDKNLVDYSDGSHGENDFDDWDHLYLPTFQLESRIFEGLGFELPLQDQLHGETLELVLQGWDYDENLSNNFTLDMNGWSPIDGQSMTWFVYVKTNEAEQPSNRTIRVYAMPDIAPVDAAWTLSFEGNLNENGNLIFYSQQNEIDNVMDQMS